MTERMAKMVRAAAMAAATLLGVGAGLAAGQELKNASLVISVDERRGAYEVAMPSGAAILQATFAAEVDHRWVRSDEYPARKAEVSAFHDALGSGKQITLTCSGLAGQPDLIFVAQMYEQKPYGALQVRVRNTSGKEVTVQAIRTVAAQGGAIVALGGKPAADRVLSDSFSEDWPEMKIYDLGGAPEGLHRGVGSQLVYNRESKESFFIGALDSERFLTILRLQAEGKGGDTKIASYTVDATGTTEIQKLYDYALKNAPADQQVELSLPVAAGAELSSERVMVAAGKDYFSELREYGEAIRTLHNARVNAETPIGWWSWTAFYGAINEAETLANARWQAEHLKQLGYVFFQVDEGYQYARGEFTTTNAVQFPSGMRVVGQRVTNEGLTLGLWTAPFEVTSRAWVYQNHKDWLVHTAQGEPISSGKVWQQDTDAIYTLDTTHPGAQEYLRQTYKTLVREWGVRFIKLDFMDTTAIEGYHYRPNTTALEAQRIGLQIIRESVGNDVLLDKDGSPMLNVVGLTDTGRVSTDTAHEFAATKEAATGIAARFYMHRNFFLNDPDAFNTTSQEFAESRHGTQPLSLDAAKASIALSAVSGGMYEIGDDMTTYPLEKDRLALVENQELLNMAKFGRAAEPVDLLTYEAEDEQPSIFLLRESPRQAVLTVFNWTNRKRSRTLDLKALGFSTEHLSGRDLLSKDAAVVIESGSLRIAEQAPESVRMILLVDSAIPMSAPKFAATIPSSAKTGEAFVATARLEEGSVGAVGYHWDFGDGIVVNGARATHVYNRAGTYKVKLTVDSIEGVVTQREYSIAVTGKLKAFVQLKDNVRFKEPMD